MGRSSKNDILQSLNVSAPCELLQFLLDKEVRKNRNAIKNLLKHKQILVNDKIVTQFDHTLKEGDRISIMRFDQAKKEIKLQGIKIVYEDDYLIVIDKSPGFLSVSTPKEVEKTAQHILQKHVNKKNKDVKIFLVHRMEREMSGLMLFAKDQQVQHVLRENWDKMILAYPTIGIIDGTLEPAKGTIVSWLTENRNFEVFSSNFDNGGQRAVTHYEVLKTNGKYSLVRFDLETRKKNQLRAQLEQLQKPIVGDRKYGAKTNPIKRIALHIDKLIMKHPVTGNVLEFISPLNKTMLQLLNSNNTQYNDE